MQPIFAFDFDGVILDSNSIKEEAFIRLFQDRSEEFKTRIREFHRMNRALTRHENIATWLAWEQELVSADMVDQYLLQFGQEVSRGYELAQTISGVEDFLGKAGDFAHSLHVVSAGNPDEIQAALLARALHSHFHSISGGGKKKADILLSLTKESGLEPETLVFFGDAISDYEAAQVARVRFVGVRNPDLQSLPGTLGYIESFEGIHPRDFLS